MPPAVYPHSLTGHPGEVLVLVQLAHLHWQILRTVLRAETAGESPPLGRELRISPTRSTKDGTFLDELVAEGLLEPAGKPEKGSGEPAGPAQFRTRYALTDKGRHAAEYGEYDRPYTPGDTPLVGTAAAIVEARAARRGLSPPSTPPPPGPKRKK
jgi:hypothetical protein